VHFNDNYTKKRQNRLFITHFILKNKKRTAVAIPYFGLNSQYFTKTTLQTIGFFNFTKTNAMKILILNGPNLNLLGKREPTVYGNETFETYFEKLKLKFPTIALSYYQSNIEGELIDKIQAVGFSYDGIILNAGAYTHTSIGIADAIKAITTPVVEVHISNTFSRESFRHQSYISPNAKGVIIGFGLQSYELALRAFK